MDVLKISDTKVKIMLTRADVKKFKLDTDNVDYSDAKTRSKVWEILDCVKKHHGWSSNGDKLLIQFYPSRDGGAELFVTKLDKLSDKNEKTLAKSQNVTLLDSKRVIYVFKNFDDLLRASRIVKNIGGIKNSELFYDENEGYFLEITERGGAGCRHIPEFAILLEYSSAVPRELYPYINEHYNKLTKGNAIEQLARL